MTLVASPLSGHELYRLYRAPARRGVSGPVQASVFPCVALSPV